MTARLRCGPDHGDVVRVTGLLMFLAPAKHRAELCLEASDRRCLVLHRSIQALQHRLHDTAALLQTLELQLKAERNKKSETLDAASGEQLVETYTRFAKPPAEVIRNDSQVGVALSSLLEVESHLEVRACASGTSACMGAVLVAFVGVESPCIPHAMFCGGGSVSCNVGCSKRNGRCCG